jgi:NADPH:quinone reductase-like Zn-dependent oxidoreductase
MKAIVCTKYGPPDVLQLKDVEKPTPKDNEVLIRIYATTVTAGDCGLRSLKFPLLLQLLARIGFGFRGPRKKILGQELAGEIEAVGKEVTRFRQGDQVFGWSDLGLGAYAEYTCLPEKGVLAIKPSNITYEEAAALPVGGLDAVYFLRRGRIQSGQKVLINGAGGSIGTFAIQLAKYFGADVTAVDSTGKLDLLRSIGADQVIDYTQADFTNNGQRYDLILDVVASRSIFDYKRALSPKGMGVIIGGSLATIFQALLLGPWISLTGRKKLGLLIYKQNQDLVFMKELLEAGKVVPVIDRRYPLSEVAEALRYFGEGHVKGKVVITLE